MQKTHGLSRTKEYASWSAMHRRCSNPDDAAWKHYGGRGIQVCKRWFDFEAFLADMGAKPYRSVLDRIDNDGNYTPKNCRWTNRRTSAENRRCASIIFHDGESRNASQWARQLKISPQVISARIKSGLQDPRKILKHLKAEMTETEKLIRDLKSRINPATGNGWEYAEIGAFLGITKQGAIQHVHNKKGQCVKCLRPLRRAPRIQTP